MPGTIVGRGWAGLGLGVWLGVAWALALGFGWVGSIRGQEAGAGAGGISEPFASFVLPGAWLERFRDSAETKALREMEPGALIGLVSKKGGVRLCGCPHPECVSDETLDPLEWSILKPESVTCRFCGRSYPNEDFPAKVNGKVLEELVEARPGLTHALPYHLREQGTEQRFYLEGKRDEEAKRSLAKAALYLAESARSDGDAARAAGDRKRAALILGALARESRNWIWRSEPPNRTKVFWRFGRPNAARPPATFGRWDAHGALEVPQNAVFAFAALPSEAWTDEVNQALGVPDARVLTAGWLRESALIALGACAEESERDLLGLRGVVSVARLLGDERLADSARARVDAIVRHGFAHDGTWRDRRPGAQRAVLEILSGWLSDPERGGLALSESGTLPLARANLALRARGDGSGSDSGEAGSGVGEVLTTGFGTGGALGSGSGSGSVLAPGAFLLGGAGVAGLSAGSGADQLRLELRGYDALTQPFGGRLSLRLELGGHVLLGDGEESAPRRDGWNEATVAYNVATIDGRNQRETLSAYRNPAPGAISRFHAATETLQVASYGDPRAYPTLATRYRRTAIVASGPRTRYAVDIFEVEGGARHDLYFHGPARGGSRSDWVSRDLRFEPGPPSLAPAGIVYLPDAPGDSGRWFVQAAGAFRQTRVAAPRGPATVEIPPSAEGAGGLDGIAVTGAREGDGGIGVGFGGDSEGRAGLRLHLLTELSPEASWRVYAARSPGAEGEGSRPSLVLRRERTREEGKGLSSTFATLFEPIAPDGTGALGRVGRVRVEGRDRDRLVLLYVETPDGPEHLAINLEPGTTRTARLATGGELRFDGLVARLTARELTLAGGTFAEAGGARVELPVVSGPVRATGPGAIAGSLGYIETSAGVSDHRRLTGHPLIVRHGGGGGRNGAPEITRAWTIARAQPLLDGGTRFHVRERVGFALDRESGRARYETYPRLELGGPHELEACLVGSAALP